MTGSEAIIGQGTFIRGNLDGDGDLVIEGTVHGNIDIRGQVQLETSSLVRADVSAQRIVVRGAVRGDLTAVEQIMLEEPCRVVGNLQAPSICIGQGALYRGRIAMNETQTRIPKPIVPRQITSPKVQTTIASRSSSALRSASSTAMRQATAVVDPGGDTAEKLTERQELSVQSRSLSNTSAKSATASISANVTAQAPQSPPPPTIVTPRTRSVAQSTSHPEDHQPPPPVVPALKKKTKGAVRKKSAG